MRFCAAGVTRLTGTTVTLALIFLTLMVYSAKSLQAQVTEYEAELERTSQTLEVQKAAALELEAHIKKTSEDFAKEIQKKVLSFSNSSSTSLHQYRLRKLTHSETG